jgi:transcriptional regulator with XRE-family HTH domain
MITAKQSRMARVALNWTTSDLAQKAGVGRATVARLELGNAVAEDSAAKVQAALEAAGAAFGDDGNRVLVSVPK